MQTFILRGVPGSGKSFLAKQLAKSRGAVIVSADTYFEGRKIAFNPALIGEAHASCFRAFLRTASAKRSDIVVDNTNLTAWEISPYYLGSAALGYDAEILEVDCDPSVAFARQTHGVPAHVHKGMAAAFYNERLPPFWKITRRAL